MQLVLADDQHRDHLLPFTFTRPVADLRVGILTIRRKWEILLGFQPDSSASLTRSYLSLKYPSGSDSNCLFVNGALLPDESVLRMIQSLKLNQQLIWQDRVLAAMLHRDMLSGADFLRLVNGAEPVHYIGAPSLIQRPWDIFTMNDVALRSDFTLITRNRRSEKISGTNQTNKPDDIFIEPGAKVECAILNAATGPIYIGKDAEVMEGAMIRGPFALGEQAVIKMGAKIYGATTIGPGSKVGGEVSNSVIFANSNKAHDGFLGNSVLGEWCNLGADTNNSNLKNNYSEVKVWNYVQNDFTGTGLIFCGLFMGDHSKCSINTMFNTGTLVGVFANIFGAGFPPKFVPNFSWGSDQGGEMFMIDKALNLAEKVMARRNIAISDADRSILSHLYLMQVRPPGND
jgi:UDP-N-acetylglucosamine diphosphorylase/glucosamine-1-phosphate N-acetyltransferase